MNSRSSRFDVGSISSINPTGNRDVVYVLKGEANTNKAIDKLMKGAPIIIPQHLKPDEKVKEKLD